MLKPPAVCCFDFDGTLADGYPAIASSVNHVRQKYGLPPLPVPEVQKHVGRGLDHLLQHTMPGADIQIVPQLYRAHYAQVMRDGTELLPGAREALVELHGRRIRLAVCSNKLGPFTRELLDHLGLMRYLDTVLGPDEVAQPKPAPDMLLAALERLGAEPRDALYVGDMTVDIQTARAAGVRVWVVATGSDTWVTLQQAEPDRLLKSLMEFLPAWRETFSL